MSAKDDALERCDVLKRAGFWRREPKIRPQAWLANFSDDDQDIAATLLDRFTYIDDRSADSLLEASFGNLVDGLPKGPMAAAHDAISAALNNCIFTPVLGETPKPTDSGNFICRKVRQVMRVEDERICSATEALDLAYQGNAVIFLDDLIGSGEQFLGTWQRDFGGGRSFKDAQAKSGFVSIYIALVGTQLGMSDISRYAPEVAVSVAYPLNDRNTLAGIRQRDKPLYDRVECFLTKYESRLRPREEHISANRNFVKLGYKRAGLLLAFDHSVPDLTLPIYWAPGDDNWVPLMERV